MKVKLKDVKNEFELIKQSRWSSFENHTLKDIVDNWANIKDRDNENIKTIKHFVDNPLLLEGQCLSYDKKGLADGYHRLTAMKIIGLKKFFYDYVDQYMGD